VRAPRDQRPHARRETSCLGTGRSRDCLRDRDRRPRHEARRVRARGETWRTTQRLSRQDGSRDSSLRGEILHFLLESSIFTRSSTRTQSQPRKRASLKCLVFREFDRLVEGCTVGPGMGRASMTTPVRTADDLAILSLCPLRRLLDEIRDRLWV
jgi:hypothetical protein